VRVIDPDGKMIGILPTREALNQAVAAGLDLVEIDPKASPPVCKIIDFGKFKYEKKKQEARSRASQTVVELKELKLRPKTDDHDLETKGRHARRFLEEGHRVKFTVRFRGREITHPGVAQQQLDSLLVMLKDIGHVETRPMMEARTMTLIVAPGAK
jgi:translation initiation factor IF-3